MTILLIEDVTERDEVDGQNLSGQLSDWSIHDLLQIMQVTKKTGSLDVTGDQSGRIHFKQGSITGADLDGSAEAHVADGRGGVADVLYILSSIDSGSFVVSTGEVSNGEGEWSVDDILSDVDGLNKLESQVAESGLLEATSVRLVDQVEDTVELAPEDWQMLVSLVQPFTFGELESRFGRGGAVRVLHTLHRLEVAEAVTSEDESDWLDQVADKLGSSQTDDLPAMTDEIRDGRDQVASVVALNPAVSDEDEEPEMDDELEPAVKVGSHSAGVKGISAPASTTLTDGVYDEIRRLRSKVSDK